MTILLETPWIDTQGPDCTEAQVLARIAAYRSAPPAYSDSTVREYVKTGLEVAKRAHGRASAGFSQSLHETAGLRYGGQVKPSQFNFGGLGATNDGAQGGAFPSIWHGWMAFWAHHMNYWWGPLHMWPEWAELFKPHAFRNAAVLSAGYGGTVKTIGDYTNGKWAWSPQYPKGTLLNGYAYAIRDGANAILALPQGEESTVVGIPGVPFIAADARHYTPGRRKTWPYYLIQHHTDGFDSLNWLTSSPNSNVSATYLLNTDGTIRAQLVSHIDTPHTTGHMNDDSISAEWERYWSDPARRQFPTSVPDAIYRRIGEFWAKVVLVERGRGNPHFQGTPKREQMRDHNDFYSTVCPGNLDTDRVYAELTKALAAGTLPDQPPKKPENPHAKYFESTGHWIINNVYDGVPVEMLDFYEDSGGMIGLGLPLEGMHQDADGVYRQATEGAILEMWPSGFGNVSGQVYRFGRYLDHVDRLRGTS